MKHYFLLCLLFFSVSNAYSEENSIQQTYTVGVVPQFNPRTIYSIWQPILDKIEEQIGIHLILQGTPSIPEFEKELLAGKFDFAYMNPYHMLIANDTQGYKPLIRDHVKSLSGILVVAKESSLNSPSQLNNKTIVFPSANALGATMMIRSDLQDKFSTIVKPKYVLSHDSVYLNVAMGFSIAGGGVLRTLEKQTPKVRQRLRILHHTKSVTAHPFGVHPRVPLTMQNQVRKTLLSFSKTEKGKELFNQIPMSQSGIADMSDYRALSTMNLERFYQKVNQ